MSRFIGGHPMAYAASGFTIIELMITVTIAGILALVAAPSISGMIANQRTRAAATEIHLSLLLARSEAIKRNANIDLIRTGATWSEGWTVQSGATVLRTTNALEGNVTVVCEYGASDCDGDDVDTMTFTRTGRPEELIAFEMYNSADDKVQMRCIGVSLSGTPAVKLDKDFDNTNGCNE